MSVHAAVTPPALLSAGKPLRIGLWLAQSIVAVAFIASGVMKLTTPINELSAMMPWAGEVSVGFVRFIALVDLAGGIGILFPSLTRIQPRLTVVAALGCVVLQVLAFGFHAWRGEFIGLPVNLVLLALSAFVFWGRSRKAPVLSRG
jgi:uncharacterized membrane protein YphA (DoxX/SURF4 family)